MRDTLAATCARTWGQALSRAHTQFDVVAQAAEACTLGCAPRFAWGITLRGKEGKTEPKGSGRSNQLAVLHDARCMLHAAPAVAAAMSGVVPSVLLLSTIVIAVVPLVMSRT